MNELMSGDSGDEGSSRYMETPREVKILGRRWSVPILQRLNSPGAGKLGFMDLQRSLKKVSPKVLSERLRQLADEKLVKRCERTNVHPKRVDYYLTEKGSMACKLVEKLKGSNVS